MANLTDAVFFRELAACRGEYEAHRAGRVLATIGVSSLGDASVTFRGSSRPVRRSFASRDDAFAAVLRYARNRR